MQRRTLFGLVAGALAAPALARAAGFPERPIVMIVPYAPGGSADVLARVIAPEMSAVLGQPVVVELRPGAGGNIGAAYVAQQARPDGYTFLFGSLSLSTSVSLTTLSFDTTKDLKPIAGIGAIPHLMVVSPQSPFHSLGDVLAAARARPGAISYGSSGPGTGSHLAGELLAAAAEVQLLHVPYRGSGAVYPDLIAQRISFLLDVMGSSLGQVQAGAVRPVAITAAHRSRALPEVPTFAESGVPGFSFATWFGFFAPAAAPQEAMAKLESATLQALQTVSVRERLEQVAADPVPGPGREFAGYFAADVARWAQMVQAGRLQRLD